MYNKSWLVWIIRNTLGSIKWKCWNVTNFGRFGAEHIPREITKISENKNIIIIEYKHTIQ